MAAAAAVEVIRPAVLNTDAAAAYLGRTRKSLERMRAKRIGPASFNRNRRVMYRVEALDEWLAAAEASDSRSNLTLDPTRRAPEARAISRKTRSNGNGAGGPAPTPLAKNTPLNV